MRFSCHYKRLHIKRLKIAVLALIISLFLMPNSDRFKKEENNYYEVSLNGTVVGFTGSEDAAKECLLKARKNVNSSSTKLIFADADLTYNIDTVLIGKIDDEADITSRMEAVLRHSVVEDLQRAYEMKINGYIITLSSTDDVLKVLQTAINKYDSDRKFGVTLKSDITRELPVLIPQVAAKEVAAADEELKEQSLFNAGFFQDMIDVFENARREHASRVDNLEWAYLKEEYTEPIVETVAFGDEVEVVEVYVDQSAVSDVQVALNDLTLEELTNQIYKVVSGDTLSGISQKVGIPMETIVAINDSLDSVNDTIRVDQELIVTAAEPKLPVVREVIKYFENDFQAEPIISYDEDQYTDYVRYEGYPSDGFRKMIAKAVYKNDELISDLIPVKEEVICEAVPLVKVVGTKIRPSYTKPINGGRVSSTFGYRKRPTKGASTYHKGIDWAVPTGTPVYASCGGTVAKAGWGSGYGYCVYINHPDGKQTRYGHLSKVLVSAGKTVKQGDRIALSGNTGVSTGPHLHFEILVGGSQVDPFRYVSR